MKKFWFLRCFFPTLFPSLEICFYFLLKLNAQKNENFFDKTNFSYSPGTFNCLLSKGNKLRVKSVLMGFCGA